jgi:Predicted carboxypeptidase
LAGFAVTAFACAPAPAPAPVPAPIPAPTVTPFHRLQTRAESSDYQETSTYDDVLTFINSLKAANLPLSFGSIGRTNEGREIPYIVASRPRVSTPAEAKALHRPIVYVQGNIHAGEVEGKEAVLALVRDLNSTRHLNALDSLVLIIVPIYNADGNERFASQTINRTEQNGPERVGVRANAQGLDLNRDYIKAEAPETRGSLAMFNAWDPDVFVDLHTTDGSFHGYALTYAPSLNPAAQFGGLYARDSMLPVIRERMMKRHGFAVFDYGDFISDDTLSKGWVTFDSRPRFGTNYYGMRGRISILSEAFSHDSFRMRIASTYLFVQEILSLVAERSNAIMALGSGADQQQLSWGRSADSVQRVPIRSELSPTPPTEDVVAEIMEHTTDSTRTEPGVPRGLRRTGRFQTVRMPVFDRFDATLEVTPPAAYAVPARDTAIARLLALHGLAVERLGSDWSATVESFTIDSIVKASRPFQGHLETRVRGTWRRGRDAFGRNLHRAAGAAPRTFGRLSARAGERRRPHRLELPGFGAREERSIPDPPHPHSSAFGRTDFQLTRF